MPFPADSAPATDTTAFASATAGVQSIPESRLADSTNTDPASDDNPETNGAAGDKFGSIENVTGSAQDDSLTGDANPNILRGNAGDDTINGLGGNDPLLYGGPGDDTINGGDGNDKLVGCTGDDTLNGGAGNDTLEGVGGDDTFVFTQKDAGDSDAILDWDRTAQATSGDQIDLSAFGLTKEQLMGAITLRGSGTDAYLVINLTEFGGGRITINDIASLDALEIAGTTDNGIANDNGELDSADALSVGDDGIFIL